MDFKWYLNVIKNHYADFSGRVSRRDFWMFYLHSFVIGIVVNIVDAVLTGGGVLGGILSLALFLPAVGMGVRRLQDTGRSGWWYVIIGVPLIGAITLIIFWVGLSQEGSNEYGEKPANTI